MAHSLLDGADLTALRQISAGGAPDALAAALVDSGLLQFDPDDLEWEDRDRLIVYGEGVSAALGRRLAAAGAVPDGVIIPAPAGGDAMALAFGAAMASGGVWRSWCVLDADADDDGRVWEIARAASEAPATSLGVLAIGNGSAQLWAACGWTVHEAPASDPAWALGALDQVVAGAPAVLLAVDDA